MIAPVDYGPDPPWYEYILNQSSQEKFFSKASPKRLCKKAEMFSWLENRR